MTKRYSDEVINRMAKFGFEHGDFYTDWSKRAESLWGTLAGKIQLTATALDGAVSQAAGCLEAIRRTVAPEPSIDTVPGAAAYGLVSCSQKYKELAEDISRFTERLNELGQFWKQLNDVADREAPMH